MVNFRDILGHDKEILYVCKLPVPNVSGKLYFMANSIEEKFIMVTIQCM